MTIGVWAPADANEITLARLTQCLDFSTSEDLTDMNKNLPPSFVESEASLMTRSNADWDLLSRLENPALVALAHFFTLAEMQLAGWQGGRQSPVIYIVKILKERGEFTAELRKWIKSNSDNRYLPNGAAL